MAVFDPYKTYRGGFITGQLLVAQEALNRAFVDAVAIAPDADYKAGIAGAVNDAQKAVRAALAIDLWELARPEREDRECSCAMTETSARLCPVHGEDAPPL